MVQCIFNFMFAQHTCYNVFVYIMFSKWSDIILQKWYNREILMPGSYYASRSWMLQYVCKKHVTNWKMYCIYLQRDFAVMYEGFFGIGGQCFGGPFFEGRNKVSPLCEALKFWIFYKFALKLLKIKKVRRKCHKNANFSRNFSFVARVMLDIGYIWGYRCGAPRS